MNRNPFEGKSTAPVMAALDRIVSERPSAAFLGIGDTLTSSGRQFIAVAAEPYTSRDGTPSQIVTWRGHCATCGAPYDVKGSRHASHLPKNCEAHRGRRTKRARRRHSAREVIARAYVAMQNGDIERARKLLANEMKRKPEREA